MLQGFDDFKQSLTDEAGASRVDLVLSCVDNYEARMTINQVSEDGTWLERCARHAICTCETLAQQTGVSSALAATCSERGCFHPCRLILITCGSRRMSA